MRRVVIAVYTPNKPAKARLFAAFIATLFLLGPIPLPLAAQHPSSKPTIADDPSGIARARFIEAVKAARSKRMASFNEARDSYLLVVNPILDKTMESGNLTEANCIQEEINDVRAGRLGVSRSKSATVANATRKFQAAFLSLAKMETAEFASAKSDYVRQLGSLATQALKDKNLIGANKFKDDADRLRKQSLEDTVATIVGNSAHVNLLTLIDLNRDRILGKWTLDNDVLRSAKSAAAFLEFPYTPPDEYDFHFSFARESGSECIQLKCAHGSKPFTFMIGGWRNTITAFANVAKAGANGNVTTKRSAAWMKNGQVYDCVVKVRNDRLEAFIDDQLIISHLTDYSDIDLSPLPPWKHPDRVGFHTFFAGFRIETAEIIEISGTGTIAK